MPRKLIALAVGTAAAACAAFPGVALAAGSATTGNATSITADGADLNGVAVASGRGSDWLFQYSQTPRFTAAVSQTPAVPLARGLTAVERHVTGLSAGTTYYFRLVVQTPERGRTLDSFGATGELTTLGAAATTSRPYAIAPARGRARARLIRFTGRTAAVLLGCAGPSGNRCAGTVEVVRAATVCARAHFTLTAPATRRLAFTLARGCSAADATAEHHRLSLRVRVIQSR